MPVASGSFYYSPIFWAGAGVAVAIATLVIIILQLLTASTRRTLIYSLLSDTALLTEGAREKAGPDLQVALGGEALDDPHVVSIRIECKGRRDIRMEDFQGTKPLTLDVGVKILKMLSPVSDEEAELNIKTHSEDRAIAIGPGHIKNGQSITFDLLTNGGVNLHCNSPIADVAIRQAQSDEKGDPEWIKRVQAGAFTLFGVGLFGWLLASPGPVPFYFVLSVMLFGILGFFISIARAVASRWRHAGRAMLAADARGVGKSQPTTSAIKGLGAPQICRLCANRQSKDRRLNVAPNGGSGARRRCDCVPCGVV
jgi:hypothetical protein